MANRTVVVTGAGGFIAGQLVSRLLPTGSVEVRTVVIKPFSQWHQIFDKAENLRLDCSRLDYCKATRVPSTCIISRPIWGMGFITNNRALCIALRSAGRAGRLPALNDADKAFSRVAPPGSRASGV
jgi:hypothetical protein